MVGTLSTRGKTLPLRKRGMECPEEPAVSLLGSLTGEQIASHGLYTPMGEKMAPTH